MRSMMLRWSMATLALAELARADAQRNYELTGASDPEAERVGRIRVRPPGPDDRRDDGWRPISDEEFELGEPGVDQGRNYPFITTSSTTGDPLSGA